MMMMTVNVLDRFRRTRQSTEQAVGHAQLHGVRVGLLQRLVAECPRVTQRRRPVVIVDGGGSGVGRRGPPRRAPARCRRRPSTSAAGVEQGDERVTELGAGRQVEEHVARVVRQADLTHTHTRSRHPGLCNDM